MSTVIQLPGGLIVGGERSTAARLRPVDGRLELAIEAEARNARAPLPERITRVLLRAVASIGDASFTAQAAEDLAVADRQVLMLHIAQALGRGEAWQSHECSECHELFDYVVRCAELPVRPALASYPVATAHTSVGPLAVRVPTGADQAAAEAETSIPQARRTLLERCLRGACDRAIDVDALSVEDVAEIERSVEEVAPAVATRASGSCPACGVAQILPVDLYIALQPNEASLLDEVHLIASNYHWSERAILALPRERRRSYLRRIERSAASAS